MATRKIRTDSTEAKKMAAKAAQTKLKPPEPLNKKELKYWESIIDSRALDSWTPIDQERALKLARLYVELDEYENELKVTRRWFTSDSGLAKIHPLHYIVEDLYKREIQLCRSLQIHSRATNGESRDQIKTNKLYQEIRDTLSDDDGLIARAIN